MNKAVVFALLCSLGACGDDDAVGASDAASGDGLDVGEGDATADPDASVDGAPPDGSPPIVGDGILAGDPTSDAWAALPSTPIPDPGDDELEDRGAYHVVRRRVVLFVAEGASVGSVNALAASLDATLLAADPRIGRLILRIPAEAVLDDAVAIAAAHEAVETATLSLVLRQQALPQAHASPPGLAATPTDQWQWRAPGSNWGLAFVRAPAAWNLAQLLRQNRDFVPRLVAGEESFTRHEDLQHVPDFFDRFAEATSADDASHANGVLGLLSSRWDGRGIESVFPTVPGFLDAPVDAVHYDPGISHTTTDQIQDRFFGAVAAAAAAGRPLILNFSAGTYPVNRTDTGFSQMMPDVVRRDLDPQGDDWAAWARRVDGWTRFSDWLMTCSAGNTYVSDRLVAMPRFRDRLRVALYSARENSGCSNAASRALSDHFIAVEALSRDGTPWTTDDPNGSARGGTIAAPGQGVGHAAGPTNRYEVGDGTSFAAPMVGSTLALLWTLAPGAPRDVVRRALVEGAMDPLAGSARRLDVWGAVQRLAVLREIDLPIWLADVDDGTNDGALRVDKADGSTVVSTGNRGDGCVDMRDLRAFRDALWDARRAPHPELDGGLDHPLRDGNLDGQHAWLAPTVPAAAEGEHSRFDFDGNGLVSLFDVEVMALAWGRCRDGAFGTADTEGVAAADLERYLSSVDLWVPLAARTRIFVSGAPPVVADPAGTRVRNGLFLLTLPIDACTSREIRVGSRSYRLEGEPIARDVRIDDDPRFEIIVEHALAYVRTGSGVAETALHRTLSGYSALALVDYPFLSSPSGGRVAGSAIGALQVATRNADDSVSSRDVAVPGVRVEIEPWEWAPHGRGLLARAYESDAVLAYVDAERGTAFEIAPSVGKDGGDWPGFAPDGTVLFAGNDGWLYRAATDLPPPVLDEDDLFDWASGTFMPTCDAGPSSPATRVLDLSSFRGRLVHASPSAIASDGKVLLAGSSGGVEQLIVASDDLSTRTTILADWEPRGGAGSPFELMPSDGVAWLPDGKGVLYVAADGVHRITWTSDGVPAAGELVTSRVSTRVGPIAPSPSGTHFVVMVVEGPPSALVGRVYIVRLSDGMEVGPFDNRIERGLPTWSPDGGRLAYASGSSTLSDIVVVSTAGAEVFDTRTYTTMTGSLTVERYPTWAVDLRSF